MAFSRISREIKKIFDEQENKLNRAEVIALNRAGRSALSQTIKFIRDTYNIKAKDLRDEIKISAANKQNRKFKLKVSHKAIGLIKYGAKQNNKGVRFTEKKGERKFYKSAFITGVRGTKSKSTHTGVFKRVGKSRLPIKELYGPSAMQLMSSKEAQQFIEKVFYERLEIEMQRALQYGK